MAILLMFGWWYSQGWLWTIKATEQRLHTVAQVFAVKILLRTLFAPWKQIYSPSTFGTFLRNAADNAISRTIGAIVRATILFWALILSIGIIVIGIISFLLWPLMPLLVVILPILTAVGAFS